VPSFWVVIDGKNFRTGEHIQTKRFGPYASEEEAEQAEQELFPEDGRDYVYRVHIEEETDTS
jgi:hypothetical protein